MIALLTRLVLAAGAGASLGLCAVAPGPAASPRAPASIPADEPPLSPALRGVPDITRKSERPNGEATETRTYDVTFWHVHTRELLPYRLDEAPPPLAHFLRCRATGDERAMSAQPFRWAAELAVEHGRRRVVVVSGLRSPKFNEYLRKHGHEVARSSYHPRGEALDFRIPGVSVRELIDELDDTHPGGLGQYRESRFIHLDTGPRRRWRGR